MGERSGRILEMALKINMEKEDSGKQHNFLI